jgi:hypothetical protein
MKDYLLLTVMMDDVGTWSLEMDRKWDCSQALMLQQKTWSPRISDLGDRSDFESMKQVRHFLQVSNMR